MSSHDRYVRLSFTLYLSTGMAHTLWEGENIEELTKSSIEDYLRKVIQDAPLCKEEVPPDERFPQNIDIKREVVDPTYSQSNYVEVPNDMEVQLPAVKSVVSLGNEFEVDLADQDDLAPALFSDTPPNTYDEGFPADQLYNTYQNRADFTTDFTLDPSQNTYGHKRKYSEYDHESANQQQTAPILNPEESINNPKSAANVSSLSICNGDETVSSCYFCQKMFISNKMLFHYQRRHTNKQMVIDMSRILDETTRSKLWSKLINVGNLLYNSQILSGRIGKLIVADTPNMVGEPDEYLPCESCYGFYHTENLLGHWQKCHSKVHVNVLPSVSLGPNVAGKCLLFPLLPGEGSDRALSSILSGKNDITSGLIGKDSLVLEYAKYLLSRIRRQELFNLTAQKKIQLLERLLQSLQPESSAFVSYNALLTPRQCERLVSLITTDMDCDLNTKVETVGLIKQLTKLKIGLALKVGNLILFDEAEGFETSLYSHTNVQRMFKESSSTRLIKSTPVNILSEVKDAAISKDQKPTTPSLLKDSITLSEPAHTIYISEVNNIEDLESEFNVESHLLPTSEVEDMLAKLSADRNDQENNVIRTESDTSAIMEFMTDFYPSNSKTGKENPKIFWTAEENELFFSIHTNVEELPSRSVMDRLLKALPHRREKVIRAKASNEKQKYLRLKQTHS